MSSVFPLLSPAQAWWVLPVARLTPSVLIFVFYAFSLILNTMMIRLLGLSVVYAVWSWVGVLATALIGCLYFNEPLRALKTAGAGLIVLGVVGLHYSFRQLA